MLQCSQHDIIISTWMLHRMLYLWLYQVMMGLTTAKIICIIDHAVHSYTAPQPNPLSAI
jgi:hypothetical protein